MSHTPGPWSRTGDDRFRNDHSAGVKGPDGTYVAAALDFNRADRDDEVEANARLIASAPDMYEELKQRISGCHVCLGAGHVPNNWVPRCLECMGARDIVAKIEGGES